MPPLVVELSCRDIMRGDYILQLARRSGHNLLGVSTNFARVRGGVFLPKEIQPAILLPEGKLPWTPKVGSCGLRPNETSWDRSTSIEEGLPHVAMLWNDAGLPWLL